MPTHYNAHIITYLQHQLKTFEYKIKFSIEQINRILIVLHSEDDRNIHKAYRDWQENFFDLIYEYEELSSDYEPGHPLLLRVHGRLEELVEAEGGFLSYVVDSWKGYAADREPLSIHVSEMQARCLEILSDLRREGALV